MTTTTTTATAELAGLKPVPSPSPDTLPYWQGLKEGRVLIQKCDGCGKLRHYPRPVCDACYASEHRWVEAKGTGTVHSWTVAHHPFAPGFKGEVPYVLVTVDMAEGFRMQAPLRGVAVDRISIGFAVRVAFEPSPSGWTYPAFVAA
jgi:uncharacterized OB-fold protein